MIKIFILLLLVLLIFYWLKRRHALRNTELNTPSITNGVKNSFGARKNYM